MPMLDAYIPEGALTPEAEHKLLGTCTDLLLEHEGAYPTNQRARSLAWVFVHRHETYVAGAPAEAPHYKFVCQVPQGQYDNKRRAARGLFVSVDREVERQEPAMTTTASPPGRPRPSLPSLSWHWPPDWELDQLSDPTERYPLVVRLQTISVRVRPVDPGDGPGLQALLGRMSLHTRWLRFHSPIAQLTSSQLRSVVEVDHRDHETLLAEVELDGGWHLAGFAQYHRPRPGNAHADSAIVLEDAWQGQGIGKVLARCLAETARLAGIVALTGEVLSENRRALGFVRALAPRLERRLHGTTTELVCWLSR